MSRTPAFTCLIGPSVCCGAAGGVPVCCRAGDGPHAASVAVPATAVVKRAQDHGVILRVIPEGIAFCPPLIASEEEIAEMFRRFGKALDETLGWLKKEGQASAA